MDADLVKQHSLVWLAKPYGTKDMQAALEQAALSVRRPTAPPGMATPVPAVAPVAASSAPTFLSPSSPRTSGRRVRGLDPGGAPVPARQPSSPTGE